MATINKSLQMNKYFELRDNNFNWKPVEMIEENEEYETFLLFEHNKSIKLRKDKFDKREMPLYPIHLERLGLNIKEDSSNYNYEIIVIPLLNINGYSLQKLQLESFGYIIFKKQVISEIREKIKSVFEAYNLDKISSEEVKNTFNCFHTVNELFNRLDEFKFAFNKTEIIIGNK